MKKRSIFVIGFAGITIVFVGLFVYANSFFGRYIKETTLENNFLITNVWKEIDISDSVKIERDKNYIAIFLEPSYKTSTDSQGKGIKTPNGEIINPEIKIIDEDGKEYSLTYSGSRSFENNEYANYSHAAELPADKKYQKVMIRSDVSIKTQKLIWSSYNIKDLK